MLCSCHEHVNVVGHQDIRMYAATIFIGGVLQDGQIKSPVFIRSKTSRTVDATLDEVLRDACHIDSGLPSNGKRSRSDTKYSVSMRQAAAYRCRLLRLICVGIEPDLI